jgi:hypothetical protein
VEVFTALRSTPFARTQCPNSILNSLPLPGRAPVLAAVRPGCSGQAAPGRPRRSAAPGSAAPGSATPGKRGNPPKVFSPAVEAPSAIAAKPPR